MNLQPGRTMRLQEFFVQSRPLDLTMVDHRSNFNVTFHTLLYAVLFYWGVSAIEILKFQPDGKATMDSIAIYAGKLDPEIHVRSITLCARIKVFFFHGRDNFFHLYDNATNNRYMIRTELWMDRARPVWCNSWHFQVFPKKLETHRWYHMCFTYDSNTTKYQTYLNGDLIYESYNNVTRDIYGSFAILGQGDNPDQSFSGELTQLNIWKRVITKTEVQKIANCSEDAQGDYLSWNQGWKLGEVESYNMTLNEICHAGMKSRNFWFTEILYQPATYICDALGTHLPFPNNMMDVRKILRTSESLFEPGSHCTSKFHAATVDIAVEGEWIRTHDKKVVTDVIPWEAGEPNGFIYENCGKIGVEGIYDSNCITDKGCALCSFDDLVTYTLIGAGNMEMRNAYFLAYQYRRDHLVFMAYGEYKIELNEGIWQWIEVVTSKVIGKMIPPTVGYNFPMGRNQWQIIEKVPELDVGETTLLLTPCGEKQYSCDDATCVPIQFRCDLKSDCKDGSDEFECDLILLPGGYRSDLSPVSEATSNYLPLGTKLLVWGITVETTLMTITVVYQMSSSWYDARLSFVNLKDNDALNIVPYESFPRIWIPTITFRNSINNAESTNDARSTLYIRKTEEPPVMEPVGVGEAYISKGSVSPLIINRKYTTTFHCDFDLSYYPFDEQTCEIGFQISTASKEFVKFDINQSEALYTGDRMLTEYMVGKLGIKLAEISSGYHQLQVLIPLKRRSGYAILNIYIPSTILLCITYVTLFFRPRIFDTRLMSSLTTLLVVATLFTQVSSYLPKTSYYKMVDIWLLFCIATIFLIIIFHTLIDATISFASGDDIGSLSFSRNPLRLSKIVDPVKKMNFALEKNFSDTHQRTKILILVSRVVVIMLVGVFNAFYWGSLII